MTMTDDEVLALISQKLAQAIGGGNTTDQISKDRLAAEKAYRGEPDGLEEEGRSQVVSRDVAEAIDTMMPSLMKIFAAGDEVCSFTATQESEEAAAAQATDFVNWVFMEQNDGYMALHTWFKDALLKKLGTIKIWFEEAIHYKRETYEGLPDDEFFALMADDDLELLEHSQRPDPDPAPQMIAPQAAPMPMLPGPAQAAPGAMLAGTSPQMPPSAAPAQPAPAPPQASAATAAEVLPPAMLHDAVFRRKHDVSQIRVANAAPDETLVDPHTGSAELPWGNRRRMSCGDLIEEFPEHRQAILDLNSSDHDYTPEHEERFKDESAGSPRDTGTADPLGRLVWVTDAYLKLDVDGDGTAEFRKITIAGGEANCSLVLENIEYDDNPFACLTPIPLPHKLIGMSIADQTIEVQRVKTALVRQALDNVYLSNNSEIFTTGELDFAALQKRRPGNVVRGEEGSTLTPIVVPDMLGEIMGAIAYFDTLRDQRTGTSRMAPGPGADTLNSAYTQTATGVNAVDTAAQERIAYYARTFAETGVKRAFRRIFELACKHINRKQTIKLRGSWVSINPAEWNERMQMRVAVGLGTNNKQVVAGQLMSLVTQVYAPAIQLQGGINGPIVFAEGVHHTLIKLVEAMGFKGGEQFFPPPQGFAPPPKAPDPAIAVAQIKAASDQTKAKATLESQERLKMFELQSQERVAQMTAAVQRELGYGKLAVDNKAIDSEVELKRSQHATDTLFATHDAHLKTHEANLAGQAASHAQAKDEAAHGLAVAQAQHGQQKDVATHGLAVQTAQQGAKNDERSHELATKKDGREQQTAETTAKHADREFHAANPDFQMPKEPPKPRGLTGLSIAHDADGIVAAKRHFDDGSVDEIPITRTGA